MRIEAKLDIVIEKLKNLETRVENLERSRKNNKDDDDEIDPNYVKVIDIYSYCYILDVIY